MIEKWWPSEITNFLTHHRIIRHHDGTRFEKNSKLRISNFFRISEARSA